MPEWDKENYRWFIAGMFLLGAFGSIMVLGYIFSTIAEMGGG